MSIYATGDTHGSFQRFYTRHFPEKKQMTRDDCVVIAGDFGAVWDGEPRDAKQLDWLENLPFTTLFVCGNHENFDELYSYPVEEWHGGYGSEDGVLNREAYADAFPHLPDKSIEIVIDGGCHAFFANYGPQAGDGTPTISREEQITRTSKAVAEFVL